MINFSIIQKSQLEGALRIDAEYYQPEYLETKRHLLSRPYLILGEHAFITDGEHGSVEFVNEGVKYLTAENIQEGFINTSDVRLVSELVDKRNKRASLLGDDVVVSIKGTVGLAAITFDEDLPANMNRDVSRIHIKDSISPFYLVSFLNSKLGKNQTLRESSGNVQQMTTLGRLRELLIPIVSDEFSNEIEQLINNARNKINDSKNLYQQAEELLLEELGLKNAVFEDELSYVVNFSDVQEANRIDAECFQPKYELLESKIKEYGAEQLTKLVQNVVARFSPKSDESYKYVDLGNISSSTGIIDGFEEVFGKDAPSRAKRILKPGDVIVSSVEGSLEKVALVAESQNDYLASTGFFQFRSEKILPEVLLILTKSIVMQLQMKKHCAGTILTAVPNEALDKMFLPVLPKKTQEAIVELVKESHEARKKSKELLEEAKRKVEEMIDSASSLQVEKGAKN